MQILKNNKIQISETLFKKFDIPTLKSIGFSAKEIKDFAKKIKDISKIDKPVKISEPKEPIKKVIKKKKNDGNKKYIA